MESEAVREKNFEHFKELFLQLNSDSGEIQETL